MNRDAAAGQKSARRIPVAQADREKVSGLAVVGHVERETAVPRGKLKAGGQETKKSACRELVL